MRAILLERHPEGVPKESDFRTIELPDPAPGDGEVHVRTLYISVDPYIRGRIRKQRLGQSYIGPILPGNPMESGCVGEVIASRSAKFSKGDIVQGLWKWQDFDVIDARHLIKVDPSLAPISTAIGVLGMPGLTAYFGVIDICSPKAGETAVVSGAAGAVGSIAGQIFKRKGCRVVGIAGSAEKVRYLTEDLGFDAAFNYKTDSDYAAKLHEFCQNGIDCYFDNVGGTITDAVLGQIRPFARIALCGQISQYNSQQPETGPRLLFNLVIREALMKGFLVFSYRNRYPEALAEMSRWVRDGSIKYTEDVVEGLENAPKAFIRMLTGGNIGKQIVKL